MDQSRRTIWGKGWLVVGALVMAATVVACADDAPDAVESPADRWTEEDIEYKLAVIDEGGSVSTDDPVIDRYATALDNAENVCPESRTMLSDIAVGSVQLLDENVPGHSENALSMLRAIHEAASGGEGLGVECTEVAATIIVMIQQG